MHDSIRPRDEEVVKQICRFRERRSATRLKSVAGSGIPNQLCVEGRRRCGARGSWSDLSGAGFTASPQRCATLAETMAETAATTARRYDRIAGFYDLWASPMELLGLRAKRQRLFAAARGRTLEVGVGTGRNLDYYPAGLELVAIDLSPRMLARARRRVERLGRPVGLEVADVAALPFAEDSFDTVTAACLFCSVADPVAGLAELRRVIKPDGQILLLEHVRPQNRLLGLIADAVSPLTRRLFGPSLNRRTETNAAAAGLTLTQVRRDGIWREITAGK